MSVFTSFERPFFFGAATTDTEWGIGESLGVGTGLFASFAVGVSLGLEMEPDAGGATGTTGRFRMLDAGFGTSRVGSGGSTGVAAD